MKFKLNKSAMDFSLRLKGMMILGARPLTREIQHYVEDPIADEILNGSLKGDTINVTFDKDKEEIVVKGSKPKMTNKKKKPILIYGFFLFIYMIQEILRNKYEKYLVLIFLKIKHL
jgi:hypothetical protein